MNKLCSFNFYLSETYLSLLSSILF